MYEQTGEVSIASVLAISVCFSCVIKTSNENYILIFFHSEVFTVGGIFYLLFLLVKRYFVHLGGKKTNNHKFVIRKVQSIL